MHRASQRLVSLSLLIFVALFTLAGVPIATAEGTPVSATPEAVAPETVAPDEGPCVATDGSALEEEWPAGLVREMLDVTGVDSSAFADPPDVPALTAVTSQVCIDPNTMIIVGVDLGPPTENVAQFYTTSIVVLSGDLEVRLVEQCANPSTTGDPACTVRQGSATYRNGGDRHTEHELQVGEWTSIPPGSILILTDVTVSFRTGDSVTRFLSSGVWTEMPPGGACPTGCGRWRTP